jgi:hypothetical protein
LQHDPLAGDVNQGVGSAEVDTDVTGELKSTKKHWMEHKSVNPRRGVMHRLIHPELRVELLKSSHVNRGASLIHAESNLYGC